MNKTTVFQHLFRASLVIGLCLTAVGVVRLSTLSSSITLKTNRYATLLAQRENVLKWLSEAVGIYFFNRYLPEWKKGVQPDRAERKKQRKLLNYTLDIEHVIDTNPGKHIDHKHPTIYLHGWGDTKNSAKLLKAFCDVLPGDLVTFNFRDYGVILAKIRYSNLGQLPDVLAALYAIKWTKDTIHPHAIDLYGYSRGGATLLNLLAVLNDKTGRYDSALENIEITPNVRAALLELLQRGSHVLDCPLTNMNVSINEVIKRRKLKTSDTADSFWVKAFEKITLYRHDGLQGLESAQQLTGLKLNMLLHFQHHDTIVSNKNEAELYKRLSTYNPKTTFVVLGDDGGHLHSHASLAYVVHIFKKMFGGSYDPEFVHQYVATNHTLHPANQLARPGYHIDSVINHYYFERAQHAKAAKNGK